MNVKIDGPRTITFTPQGISYILDMLTGCPWKNANPLINDIMNQLKTQELKIQEKMPDIADVLGEGTNEVVNNGSAAP